MKPKLDWVECIDSVAGDHPLHKMHYLPVIIQDVFTQKKYNLPSLIGAPERIPLTFICSENLTCPDFLN